MYWDEVLAFDDEQGGERTTQFAIQRELEQGPRHAAAQPPLIRRIGNILLDVRDKVGSVRTVTPPPVNIRYERSVRPEAVTETPRQVVKLAPVNVVVNPVVRAEAAPQSAVVSATDAASLFDMVSEMLTETAIPQQSDSPEVSTRTDDPLKRFREAFND